MVEYVERKNVGTVVEGHTADGEYVDTAEDVGVVVDGKYEGAMEGELNVGTAEEYVLVVDGEHVDTVEDVHVGAIEGE